MIEDLMVVGRQLNAFSFFVRVEFKWVVVLAVAALIRAGDLGLTLKLFVARTEI